MVFAPLVLAALFVVVEEGAAVPAHLDVLGRGRQHLEDPAARDRHAVKLGLGAGREKAAGRRVQAGRAEEDGRIVGGEGEGKLGGRVRGQPAGRSALGGHDKNVEIPVAVGGKGDAFAVVTPDRQVIVGFMDGQGDGRSAGRRDAVEVSFIGEGNRPAVGRNGRRPKPGRGGLGGRRNDDGGGQEKDKSHQNGNAGRKNTFHRLSFEGSEKYTGKGTGMLLPSAKPGQVTLGGAKFVP